MTNLFEAVYQKNINKRTNTVVASMTHELRTPLTGIIGLQECAIDNIGGQNEDVQEFLKPANNCAYLLLNQINNILDSCKMKFNTLKVIKEKVDFRSLCKFVFKLM